MITPGTSDRPSGQATRMAGAELLRVGTVSGALAFMLARLAVTLDLDIDTWLHLRIGDHLRESRTLGLTLAPFPLPDPFVVLADRAYVPGQWLPDVVGSLAVDHWGPAAISVLRLLAILALACGLLWATRAAADPLPAGLATGAALIGSVGGLSARPQLAGLVLFALVVGAWWRTLGDGRARWWLIPVFWIWAMVHGTWFLGLATSVLLLLALVIDAPALRPRVPRLLLLIAGCALACAATPLGPRLLLTPFAVTSAASGSVREWQPLAITQWVLASVLLVAALILVLRWRRAAPLPTGRLLVLAAAVVTALLMARLVAVGAILLAPVLAQTLQSLRSERAREPVGRTEVLAWTLPLVVAGVAVLPGLVRVTGDSPLDGTLDARLDRLPAGTVVLVDGAYAGWVEYAHPTLRLLTDLRAEVFSPVASREAAVVRQALPGWQHVLSDARVRWAVLDEGAPTSEAVRRAGWRAVATADGVAVWSAP